MADGTEVERNSQQSVDFEGEPGILNYKTWSPKPVSVTVGTTDIRVSVHMYMHIYLCFISICNGTK